VAIVRLQHIGIAVPDLRAACDCFEQLYGLTARDYRNDQGRGMQLDARILLGNACWLHVVQNWNPESRVYQFLDKQGPGLEHIALQTDNIEQDVQHLRELGLPIYNDKIFNAPDGFEAFIYPDQTLCMTVELIQPHATSWTYPAVNTPISSALGITQLQHIGIAVRDVQAVCKRFQELFGLTADGTQFKHAGADSSARIPLGNACSLQFMASQNPQSPIYQYLNKQGAGLEHIALTTNRLQQDVQHLNAAGAHPSDFENGTEQAVRIERDDATGTTVELVQPE